MIAADQTTTAPTTSATTPSVSTPSVSTTTVSTAAVIGTAAALPAPVSPVADSGAGRAAPASANPATAGQTVPGQVEPQARAAGEPVANPAPAQGSAPRRRQDAGDLVVRAGTAFEEYRQGVPGSIDTLVRLVSPLLWHTARQCGLTAAESEDVVQQTFLSLVRSKDSVSDPLAVVRWLTVSLRRLAWRERANSAKRTNEEPSDDDLPRAPSAEHTAVLTDQQRRLWEKVGELSERCRRLLAVIAFAPRPDYATIAVDLGIPVGSIGPTRGRCLAKLRAQLDGGDWT